MPVTRVADTVRRPRRDNSEFVQRVLARLEAAGVAWAPRPPGTAADGGEVVSWIDGRGAWTGRDVDVVELAAGRAAASRARRATRTSRREDRHSLDLVQRRTSAALTGVAVSGIVCSVGVFVF